MPDADTRMCLGPNKPKCAQANSLLLLFQTKPPSVTGGSKKLSMTACCSVVESAHAHFLEFVPRSQDSVMFPDPTDLMGSFDCLQLANDEDKQGRTLSCAFV